MINDRRIWLFGIAAILLVANLVNQAFRFGHRFSEGASTRPAGTLRFDVSKYRSGELFYVGLTTGHQSAVPFIKAGSHEEKVDLLPGMLTDAVLTNIEADPKVTAAVPVEPPASPSIPVEAVPEQSAGIPVLKGTTLYGQKWQALVVVAGDTLVVSEGERVGDKVVVMITARQLTLKSVDGSVSVLNVH